MRIDEKQRLDRRLGWCLLVPAKLLARGLGFVLHREHRTEPAGEIVVLKMVGGGSLLLALPALLGLKRRHPRFALTLVCGGNVAPFAQSLGIFDHVEVIEDGRGWTGLVASGIRTWWALLRRRVDTVIDLEVYSVLSTVFSLLTCARNRVGFYLESTYWRRNVLTHLVFFNRATGIHHFYAAAVRLLGADPASATDCREHLASRVRADERIEDRGASLDPDEPFVAVGAGCSDFGSVRALPLAEWRVFAARRRDDLGVMPWVFLGAAADRKLSEDVAEVVAKELGVGFRSLNLCGTRALPASLAALSRATRFVGIDSALLHAARMLGIPSVSFWGPTDPVTRLAPIHGYEEEVHYRPPVCSPCLHVAAEPPCKGDNVCMRLFTTDRVPAVCWCEDSTGAPVNLRDDS